MGSWRSVQQRVGAQGLAGGFSAAGKALADMTHKRVCHVHVEMRE